MNKQAVLENILTLIGIFFGILIMVIMAWGGFLFDVKITKEMTGPYTYIYEEFNGTAEEANNEIDRLRIAIKTDGVAKDLAIGLVYKPVNNQSVLPNHIGLILSDRDLLELGDIQIRYNIERAMKKERLVVRFPYHNMMSLFSGTNKIERKIYEYISENNISITSRYELYDIRAKKIYYEYDFEPKKT